MTKKQCKLMKRWKNGVSINSLNTEEREILLLLVSLKCCESRCDIGGDGFYMTSQLGQSAVSDRRADSARYWITTVIAAVALVIALFR